VKVKVNFFAMGATLDFAQGRLRNTGEFDAIESPFHLLLDLLHGAAR
jgi:hypothetical protein